MTQKETIYRIADSLNLPVLTDFFTTYLDRNALMFFFYFVLGAAVGLHIEQWRNFLARYRLTIITLFVLSFGILLYRIVTHFQLAPKLVIHFNDTQLLQPGMAVFLTLSVFVLYLFALWFQKTANLPVQRCIEWIGSYSYIAYLAHALVLRYAHKTADLLGGTTTVRTLIAFLLATAVSVLAAYLLRFCRLSLMKAGRLISERGKTMSS
jgi:peptidoglycan/LPS O-acetylase OafA/YrhL